jgi:hypothetical protein
VYLSNISCGGVRDKLPLIWVHCVTVRLGGEFRSIFNVPLIVKSLTIRLESERVRVEFERMVRVLSMVMVV